MQDLVSSINVSYKDSSPQPMTKNIDLQDSQFLLELKGNDTLKSELLESKLIQKTNEMHLLRVEAEKAKKMMKEMKVKVEQVSKEYFRMEASFG